MVKEVTGKVKVRRANTVWRVSAHFWVVVLVPLVTLNKYWFIIIFLIRMVQQMKLFLFSNGKGQKARFISVRWHRKQDVTCLFFFNPGYHRTRSRVFLNTGWLGRGSFFSWTQDGRGEPWCFQMEHGTGWCRRRTLFLMQDGRCDDARCLFYIQDGKGEVKECFSSVGWHRMLFEAETQSRTEPWGHVWEGIREKEPAPERSTPTARFDF